MGAKITYSKKVPEGWAFVDWEDTKKRKFKSVVPKDALSRSPALTMKATKITLAKP